ncbi:MAG: carbohydrate kinase [Nitrosomonas sp.]|nr:carbohydrate kinase [Nitrosomonas sp.]
MLNISGKSIKNVILFGEALIDVFPDRAVVGGAPLNVARHLRVFGLNPVLITRTGNDDYRQKLIEFMSGFGMSTSAVQCDPHYPTGQVLIELDQSEHTFEILANQAYDFIDPAMAKEIASSASADLVYFGTLAQRNLASRKALEEILHQTTQVPAFLDINLRKPWYSPEVVRYSLNQADYVKMNKDELVELSGMLTMQTRNIDEIAQRLIEDFRLNSLLVTCGEDGAWLRNSAGAEFKTGSMKKTPIADTVGAGDGFSAVFILGILLGWPDTVMLARANEFAAAICGIRGAIPGSATFYAHFLKDWSLS